MHLTIPLARAEKGSRLIEVISESMKETDGNGWKFVKKSRVEHSPLYLSCTGFYVEQHDLLEMASTKFEGYVGKASSNKKLLSLHKKSDLYFSKMKGALLAESIFSIGTFGLNLIIQKTYKDRYFSILAKGNFLKDDLFTLLDPEQSYDSLTFLANASYCGDRTMCGAVESHDTPQYQRIAPIFFRLEAKIKEKMFRPPTYRSAAV